MKYLLLLFMLIPNVLFSQILNQGDIDIWTENIAKFGEILDEHIFSEDDDWENYIGTFLRMKSISVNDTDDFINYFQTFLDYKVPNELEVFFRSIGWENNGHKKFFTVFFGFYSLMVKQSLERIGEYYSDDFFMKEKNEQINKILSLFNKDDLEIINDNISVIMELL